MVRPNKELYEFDEFRLDVAERTLSRRGERIPLGEKAFETLRVLVKHRNHLVGKDELMAEVWPGAIVEENNLDKNISYLRKVFGEKTEKGRFIETVRGHGYRFVAEIFPRGPALELFCNLYRRPPVFLHGVDWLCFTWLMVEPHASWWLRCCGRTRRASAQRGS